MKLTLAENNQTWNMQFYVNHEVDYFAPLKSGWELLPNSLFIYFHYLCLAMLCPGLTNEVDFGYLDAEMRAKPQIFC